ncbi:MAG TPA: 50S ribosomal protein L6 [Firmicutes bacterium]|jgi:large subunit ribosomal protein L6|nr:50S ribosomal protein L6 [Bacillota bacterium]
MSRIGKKPIPVPAGVELKVEGNTALVSGPKGKLSQEIPAGIEVVLEDGAIVVKRPNDEKKFRALHGLTRSLLANMVEGVSTGYSKTLEVNGVGYRAAKQGNKLVLTVGYSHPVEIEPFPGIEFEVPAPNKIIVKGIDKQKVGQMAAEVRGVRKPEPYKGKGIRYENEYVRKKAGKTGKAGK